MSSTGKVLMIDLDKILYFSCPDECGQIAVPYNGNCKMKTITTEKYGTE